MEPRRSAVVQDNVVDLILCDINMPVMDGLEFVKQLSSVGNAKDVPVVMITTEGSEAHVVQALSCGARGYIRKPFTAEQVKEPCSPRVGGKIIRSVDPLLAPNDRHEEWTPLLELAAREVFELMLKQPTDRLDHAGGGQPRHYFHGRTGRAIVRRTKRPLQREGSRAHGFQDAGHGTG